MNANVAPNPAAFEAAAMPAGPTLREQASDLADRFRGVSHSAYQAKSAFRTKSVNLANRVISRIENKHLKRAATVAAALGIMAITEPTAFKAGAAWAGDIEGGDVSPTNVGVAESNTAADLADYSSATGGHFVEGNDEAETSGNSQSATTPDIERNHFTWDTKDETEPVDVEKNHFFTNTNGSASNADTSTTVGGGRFLEGNEGDIAKGTPRDQAESDTTTSGTTTTAGESAIYAQDKANGAAAAAAGTAAFGGGHTADNEGLVNGIAPETGDKIEYASDLGEFNKKTGEGTIDHHLENAAEARGLHLSESEQHIADQRYLEMRQMTWDEARDLSNGYHISLTKDELDKIFEGLGENDTDAETEDDDDTDSDTSTNDKKTEEESKDKPRGSGFLEGNEAESDTDGTIAGAVVTPSPSPSAAAAASGIQPTNGEGPNAGAIVGTGVAAVTIAGGAYALKKRRNKRNNRLRTHRDEQLRLNEQRRQREAQREADREQAERNGQSYIPDADFVDVEPLERPVNRPDDTWEDLEVRIPNQDETQTGSARPNIPGDADEPPPRRT